MQRYTEIPSSQTLADSLPLILNNDKTTMSCSSGTAFPTVDVQQGMLCFRTDEKKLYQLVDPATPEWRCIADASGDARLLDGGFGNAINYEKKNLNDWNSMPTGFYEGSNMLNSPSGDTYWRVIQIRQGNSDGYSSQIAFGANSGKVCTRYQRGGIWSNWQDLYTGADGKVVSNLNADKVDDREPGHESGNIPINDGTLNKFLNADRLDGYDAGNASGNIPVSNGVVNTGLNADLLDGMQSGNASGNIPINNGKLNTNLNAEMLGGFRAADFVKMSGSSTEGQGDVNLTNIVAQSINVTNLYNIQKKTASQVPTRLIHTDGELNNKVDKNTTTPSSGDYQRTRYLFETSAAISAGDYQINELLQKLVNCAHTHAVVKDTYREDCQCNCRCDCNCQD